MDLWAKWAKTNGEPDGQTTDGPLGEMNKDKRRARWRDDRWTFGRNELRQVESQMVRRLMDLWARWTKTNEVPDGQTTEGPLMIQYSRSCISYQDLLDRGLLLTRKVLNQCFLLVKLESSLRKLYDRHHDLVDHYGISVSQMTTDMFYLS